MDKQYYFQIMFLDEMGNIIDSWTERVWAFSKAEAWLIIDERCYLELPHILGAEDYDIKEEN